MAKKHSVKKVKWKKVKLSSKKLGKGSKKAKSTRFIKKMQRFPKKFKSKSVKGVLKSGYFKVIGLFLFSLLLFLFSVADFEKEKALNPNVRGLSSYRSVNYIPSGSQLISKEMTDGVLMLKYSTNLSADQISSFYSKLAILNGWDQVNQNTFMCDSGEFSYSIMQEKDQNIVEYSLCESAK